MPPPPDFSLRVKSDLSPQAGRGKKTRRMLRPSLPSLPRRDDLDLVAILQWRRRPAALGQHVVIERDREMRALIFELAQERIDPRCADLPRLAIDDHAHCITSLSITPRST